MADDQPLLIDVEVRVGNRGVYSTKHFLESEGELYADTVEAVLNEYAGTIADDIVLGEEGSDGESNPIAVEMQALIGRIKSNGIIIDLAPKEVRLPQAKAKKNLPNSLNILMGDGEPDQLKFLSPPPDEPNLRMDAQIKAKLITLIHSNEIELGYFNVTQRSCLEKNVGKLVSVLCFVQKHWMKLLHKEFPHVPVSENSSSLLLESVGKCHRENPSKDNLTLPVLTTHCGTLSGFDWSPYKRSTRLKGALDSFKEEIEMIRGILLKKKGQMISKNSALTNSRSSAPSSFESLPGFVQLDEDTNEFFTAIPRKAASSKSSKNQRGQSTAKSQQVDKAVKNLVRVLRAKEDYVPIFLKDEDMGIVEDAFEREGGTKTLEASERALYRQDFKKKLAKGLDGVPAGVRKAMRNYLFMGEVNPTGELADEYCEFVLDVASGITADMSHIIDGRQFNSRGGNCIGGTVFGEFWNECRSILLPTATTEERRHADEMYASEVLSIPDLVRRATANLEAKVDSRELSKMPPVPSKEFVRLQFVPNNHTVEAASKFSGQLGVKRAIQTRTLRKQHPDQHWVNAYTRYVLEWLIQLRKKSPSSVEFFGQDDKAKIPMGGSFFTGGEEGHGQVFVTTVFDHTAQLIDTLTHQSLSPSVFALQTDGGPDHSLKRLQTKLALIAFFKDLNLDHFLGLRGAPNGLAHNKIERTMSPLNMALMHTSTKRAIMPPWAEKSIKSCTTMNDVRAKEKEMRDIQQAAIARLCRLRPEPQCDCNQSGGYFDGAHRRQRSGADERGAVSAVVEDGEGNQRNIFSTSLLDCIARAKRDEAQRIATQDFRAAWDASIGVPIELINGRFARLQIGGWPVLVYPRVQLDIEKHLHGILKSLDPAYDPNLNLAEDLKKMPAIKAWIDAHCVMTPYSISIQRCNNTSCCGKFRSPPAVRELAMQRQPTLQMDTSNHGRKNHFYSRDDAICLYSDSTAALTDLSDLPSKNIADSAADDKKARDSRDAKINRSLQLKSWDAKKVRSFVKCFNCGKPRCIFATKKDDAYNEAAEALERKLESISFRYSCGDLIFDDDHPVGKVITQRQQLTCESKVERAYYNHDERALKVDDVCIHCGEEGSDNFLLRQAQLEARNMTGGKQCFPICLDCVEMKKKVLCYPKKKTNKSQKRKEDQATKSAAKTAQAAKKSKK
ncbi:hypothetical protein ACHAWF_016995 [Thalassiosira exigua]